MCYVTVTPVWKVAFRNLRKLYCVPCVTAACIMMHRLTAIAPVVWTGLCKPCGCARLWLDYPAGRIRSNQRPYVPLKSHPWLRRTRSRPDSAEVRQRPVYCSRHFTQGGPMTAIRHTFPFNKITIWLHYTVPCRLTLADYFHGMQFINSSKCQILSINHQSNSDLSSYYVMVNSYLLLTQSTPR